MAEKAIVNAPSSAQSRSRPSTHPSRPAPVARVTLVMVSVVSPRADHEVLPVGQAAGPNVDHAQLATPHFAQVVTPVEGQPIFRPHAGQLTRRPQGADIGSEHEVPGPQGLTREHVGRTPRGSYLPGTKGLER